MTKNVFRHRIGSKQFYVKRVSTAFDPLQEDFDPEKQKLGDFAQWPCRVK